MPKKNATPYVSVISGPKVSSPLELKFTHPLRGKTVKLSAKTSDGKVAQGYARELSVILQNPESWKKLPEGTSEVVRSIWNHGLKDSLLGAVRGALTPLPPPIEMISLSTINPAAKDFFLRKLQAQDAALTAAGNAGGELKRMREELVAAHATIANLRAQLDKMGMAAAADFSPKLLSLAITDYLSDDPRVSGNSASHDKKLTYKSWFNGMAKTLPTTQIVQDVTPPMVIKYLSGCLKRMQPEGVGKIGHQVCAFLNHQTNGTFNNTLVKHWISQHCKAEKNGERPYWMEETEVNALLKELPVFYRRAAMVQWAGAFRIEEIPNLQSKLAFVNGDIRAEVTAEPVTGWKPKTPNSWGRVHLAECARATMRDLLKQGTYLLFPNPNKTRKANPNKVWFNLQQWDAEYLEALRAAAKSANKKGSKIDLDKLDSRTLRRSAGKRILLKSNYDIKLTAACLRDTPATVLKHYASIMPDDVSQPK